MINTTKERIAEAFLALAAKRSIQKIGVSELAEAAGVSRGTFYHHFEDLQALINWIYHQEVTLPFREAILAELQASPSISQIHVQALYKRREFYVQAFRMEGPGTLRAYAREEIRGNWILYVDQLAANNKIDDPERLKQMKSVGDMIGLGSYNQLVEWAEKGMLTAPEQLCHDMDQTILPFMEKMVSGSGA